VLAGSRRSQRGETRPIPHMERIRNHRVRVTTDDLPESFRAEGISVLHLVGV